MTHNETLIIKRMGDTEPYHIMNIITNQEIKDEFPQIECIYTCDNFPMGGGQKFLDKPHKFISFGQKPIQCDKIEDFAKLAAFKTFREDIFSYIRKELENNEEYNCLVWRYDAPDTMRDGSKEIFFYARFLIRRKESLMKIFLKPSLKP